MNLYSQEGQMDLNKTNAFFRQFKLPKLSAERAKDLEGPITLEELNKAINLSSMGKTPGLDVIPNEFYKTFSAELSPEIVKTFNESMAVGKLPPSMSES